MRVLRWSHCLRFLCGALLPTFWIAAASGGTLLHQYNFESGDASDSIGQLNGTIIGHPIFVDGRVGKKAIFLNGVKDAIELSPVDLGPVFTISLWVKPAYDGEYSLQPILSTFLTKGTPDMDKGRFFIALNDRHTQNGAISLGSGGGIGANTPATAAGAVPPGGWTLLTMVVDTTRPAATTRPTHPYGTCLFYTNGTLASIRDKTPTPIRQQANLIIGDWPNEATHFRGTIDDLRIYSGALSSDEIKQLAAAPRGSDPVGDSPVVTVPPLDQILSTLKHQHPRIILTPDRLAALKAGIKTDDNLKKWYAVLQASTDQDIAAGLPADPKATRQILIYKRQGRLRAQEFALMYLLSDDRKYLDALWKDLSIAATYPSWSDNSWLDCGEESAAFATSYDWLFETWSAEQKKTLQEAMKRNALQAALDVYTDVKKDGWYRVTFNWNQVCNGGVNMAALAMADDEPQLAAQVVRYGLLTLPRAMAQFYPDGACPEAPNYWNYANMFSTLMCCSLQDALGTDFGLTKIEGYNHVGDEPLYNVGPVDRSFNYGDSPPDNVLAPEMFWLGETYNKPQWAHYELTHVVMSPQNHPDLPLAMIWYPPKLLAEPQPNLPLDRYFRLVELVDMRSSWDDPNAAFFAFRGGDNGSNHSHLNGGSFVFDALGMRWAWMDSSEKYSAPNYFDFRKGRWVYYRTRAEGANTLVIDPSAEPDQALHAVMPVIKFVDDPKTPWAIVDLSEAYAGRADEVHRGYKFVDRQNALIEDEIKSHAPAEVWWFMHAAKKITVSEDGRSAMLEKQGKKVAVCLLSPADAKFVAMDAVPLPTSPQAKNSPEVGVRKLAVHLTGVTETRIAVELIPLIDPNGAVPAPAEVVPLSAW